MDTAPGFSMVVSQNRYLSTEDDEIHAALVVTAEGTSGIEPSAQVAQVIAIDCSGSMRMPPTRFAAAQKATKAAIDALRDGAMFAVVQGTNTARVVYPPTGLAVANPQTKRAAKLAVSDLRASGGTAMGEWLLMARHLLAPHRTAVRHVIMLTDGMNGESRTSLDRVLETCRADFSCDARGIGVDWRPHELLRIAEVLHGTADAVRDYADLAADFAAMTKSAMAKLVPELRILVRTTTSSRLDFLRQTHPTEAALTGTTDDGTTTFTTGSWAEESREYHLRLTVDSSGHALDTDIRMARVDLEIRPPGATEFVRASPPKVVLAHWTDDLKLSSHIDPRIAHYTGQTELRQAVLRGSEAHDNGDLDTAAAEWGTAVALATQLANEKILVRLRRLVEVIGDPSDGVVRVKDTLRPEDLLSVVVGSTQSSMSMADSSAASSPMDVDTPSTQTELAVTCPTCGRDWPDTAAFCGGCGTRL
ncbi:hypothetical protein [Alloactinosynnema sp. L-07]|uniref:VWA domain-containing protein n=1 Tax=Alloactinosynnema sp. L-07 TaxID=1653480 RepID=UPI00065F00C2|nr:VWA domain-containing protein [Alloactinosynnema sp. L-07]CRK55124.1 hypothetical protein [Alloactinosynnema sp. L-07]